MVEVRLGAHQDEGQGSLNQQQTENGWQQWYESHVAAEISQTLQFI